MFLGDDAILLSRLPSCVSFSSTYVAKTEIWGFGTFSGTAFVALDVIASVHFESKSSFLSAIVFFLFFGEAISNSSSESTICELVLFNESLLFEAPMIGIKKASC